MTIFQNIKMSTYGIEIQNPTYPSDIDPNIRSTLPTFLPQCGTGFAIDENHLITAKHVIDLCGPTSTLLLINPSLNQRVLGKVKDVDENADLAIIEIVGLDTSNPLEYSEKIPDIGSELMWGGFPILIGEPSNYRLRTAKGIVSSDKYHKSGGEFFEVDGIFNPGHSGAPILDFDSERVVGIVSASAGSPNQILSNLDEISQNLNLLAQLTQYGVGSQMSTSVNVTTSDLQQIISQFNKAGLPNKQFVMTGQPDQYSVQINGSETFVASIQNLINTFKLISSVSSKTYQMGLGIGTGGSPLIDLINSNI